MRIDARELEDRARGRWKAILLSIGIPETYLTGKHGPCIFCRGRDRWRWDNKDNRGSYLCGQCGAGWGIQLVQKHMGINLRKALEIINELLGGGQSMPMETRTQKPQMTEAEIKAMLNKIWDSGTALSGEDWVSQYLHSRGLMLTPDNVRFCSALYESDTKKRFPGMVSKIVDKDNIPKAIQRTYLDPELPKKADIESPKKTTPTVGSLVGCAIRLFPVKNEELGLAEGLENALACNQMFDIPVWSCVSSAILQGFIPPEGVRKIVIYGDSDPGYAGQVAAYTLAKRLYRDGLLVDVAIPSNIGQDWVDILADIAK